MTQVDKVIARICLVCGHNYGFHDGWERFRKIKYCDYREEDEPYYEGTLEVTIIRECTCEEFVLKQI